MPGGHCLRSLECGVYSAPTGQRPCISFSSALCSCRFIERSSKTPCELERVVVRPEMHEKQSGLLRQHVAMERGHLDPIFPQRFDDRVNLVPEQNKIARDGHLAASRRLEVNCGGNAERASRIKTRAVFADRIKARHTNLINPAIRLTLASDDLIDLSGIEIDCRLRSCGYRRRQRSLARLQPRANSHDHFCGITMSADVQVECL